jgi:hypothetical protein
LKFHKNFEFLIKVKKFNLEIFKILLSFCSAKKLKEQHFFTFSMIIEGASKKAQLFKKPLGPVKNKNFCLMEQK